MNILSAIKRRREITDFDTKEVPREYLKRLLDAGYWSVTGNNIPSREFVVVEKEASLKGLSRASPFVPWLNTAPVAVVIVGNPRASKYWLQDSTIAAGNIWLMATELGLGAAWGAIHHSEDPEECHRREAVVRSILQIPQSYRPVVILGIGYAATSPGPKRHHIVSEVIHKETFNHRLPDLNEL